jgi:hypothetical protein
MTRSQIIEQLFTGKNFNDCIGKMEPEHLRDDLKMEVIAIVCEWPEEKVKEIYFDGKLEFYVVRVIINMLSNKYSPFYKKFRIQTLQLTNMEIAELYGMEERELREEREGKEDQALAGVDTLDHYSAEMLRIYRETGSYRAMEKATKIPRSSCNNAIKKIYKELKNKAV